MDRDFGVNTALERNEHSHTSPRCSNIDIDIVYILSYLFHLTIIHLQPRLDRRLSRLLKQENKAGERLLGARRHAPIAQSQADSRDSGIGAKARINSQDGEVLEEDARYPPAAAPSASSRLFFLPSSSFRAGDRARFVLRIEISFGALLSGRIVKARRFIQYRPLTKHALCFLSPG